MTSLAAVYSVYAPVARQTPTQIGRKSVVATTAPRTAVPVTAHYPPNISTEMQQYIMQVVAVLYVLHTVHTITSFLIE